MTAPAWETIVAEIKCPLCEYNLRGLIEPRCPECGHQFHWDDMLSGQKTHPYLFESREDVPVRAALKTWFAGWAPWRFWSKLNTWHQPRMKRLITYGIVVSILTFLSVFVSTRGLRVAAQWQNIEDHRNYLRISMTRGWGYNYYYNSTKPIPLAQATAIVDRTVPPPALGYAFFMSEDSNYSESRTYASFALIIAMQPWLFFLAFQLFRVSMRKLSISRAHVLRCAIYAADGYLIFGIVLASIVGGMIYQAGKGPILLGRGLYGFRIPLRIWAALFLVMTIRHTFAARRYLRFPQATMSVLLIQIMLALLTLLLIDWLVETVWFLLQ